MSKPMSASADPDTPSPGTPAYAREFSSYFASSNTNVTTSSFSVFTSTSKKVSEYEQRSMMTVGHSPSVRRGSKQSVYANPLKGHLRLLCART